MLAGTLNPGQLGIVREILVLARQRTSTPRSSRAIAQIISSKAKTPFEGISDQNGDGFIQVIHLARDAAGVVMSRAIGIDGIDLLRNIERLQFNDDCDPGRRFAKPGARRARRSIDDTTPAEGQLLTANVSGVTDPNNTATNGAITGDH